MRRIRFLQTKFLTVTRNARKIPPRSTYPCRYDPKILLAPQSAAANLQRKAGNSAPPFRFCCIKLFPGAQGCNDRPVTLDVNFLKVVEQTATLTDHLQQTATGMVILLVSLEVLGEVVDALCEQSNLKPQGEPVSAFVKGILCNDFVFEFLFHLKPP